MYKIVKQDNELYAIIRTATGRIWRSDLKPWDGKQGTDYPYNVNNDNYEYYIDANDTVYYTAEGGINARIWCVGSCLNGHCLHLAISGAD